MFFLDCHTPALDVVAIIFNDCFRHALPRWQTHILFYEYTLDRCRKIKEFYKIIFLFNFINVNLRIDSYMIFSSTLNTPQAAAGAKQKGTRKMVS
jgi:hypothetical protein